MKRSRRMVLLFLAGLLALSWAGPAQVWGAKSRINQNWRGVAIKGYDPVAYFTLGRPAKGKKELEHQWQGARWRFAEPEHLDLFKADPEKYAPRYGGY